MNTTQGHRNIGFPLCSGILWIMTLLATAEAQTFYSTTLTNDQPLAYWNFDEPNPTDSAVQQIPPLDPANDLVPAFDATRAAHADIASGLVLGNTADLDGDDNFNAEALNLGTAALTTPWAIEFWMQLKPDTASARQDYIISTDFGGAQGIAFDWSPDRMYLQPGGGGVQISDQDTNWHHVVFAYYASLRLAPELDIYLDGVLNAHLSAPVTGLALALNRFVLGDYQVAGGLGFLGRLDEVAIYDLARYTTEAQLTARLGAMVSDHRSAATVDPLGVTVGISAQPADATAAVGQTPTFSVTATTSAGTLAYQWQKNWVDVPGATGSSYTTPPLQASDGGTNIFRARVSSGSVFTFTREAALVVPLSITIAQQPANAQAELGASASFSVVATSSPPAPLSYQWKRNGSAIPDATNSTYATPPLKLADVGTNLFAVRVMAGGAFIESDPAELVVSAPPTPPATPYSQLVVSDAPLLYWNFDETSGNAIQQMPVAASPTTVNDLVPVLGATRVDHAVIASGLELGFAADFDGRNNFNAEFPDASGLVSLTGPYAIEFWIQLQETAGPSSNNDYLLSFRGNGALGVVYDWESDDFLEIYGGSETARTLTNGPSIASLSDTKWHHIVWVYYSTLRDDATQRLDAYLDGARQANIISGYDAELFLLGPITVGDYRPLSGLGLTGRMDELAIYDLSAFTDEAALATHINGLVARHLGAVMPVSLSSSRAGNQLTLSWAGAGLSLQQTASLSSPAWTSLPGGATSPVTVTIGQGSTFYRLYKP